jgi:hypothetical protein
MSYEEGTTPNRRGRHAIVRTLNNTVIVASLCGGVIMLTVHSRATTVSYSP